ncbi:MAG: MBL fold metallo-hydrolase [Cyclobacteriaceae bacterium]|nr:MBL fold metallo-hydrolase [Cyclobacteriaceae bacterium]
MNLHVIDTGFFKLDGGAMFGVVPKSIWQKTNPADERNLCNWAMRCLLIEHNNTLMLIDNGLGNKQDEKFFSHYYLNGEASLERSLQQAGFSPAEVTDMFLTHLHFDHCGGGIKRDGEKLVPAFANATYWTNEDHWHWATKPNAREKASFLKENILPMQESGQLQFVKEKEGRSSPFDFMELFYASGHTDKMMIPKIRYKNHTICFMADLLPSVGHIPLPYLMGYDTRPLITLQEKEAFLNEAAANKYILFLEHDPVHECCTVQQTEKGVRLDKTFSLKEIL